VRLASLRVSGDEVLAIVTGDRWLAVSDLVTGGARTMADLIAAGAPAVESLRGAVDPAAIAARGRPLVDAELLAPVPRPGKIVAIGRNYREHAIEEGVEPPPAPLIFAKWPTAVVGTGADIRWDPALTAQVDYEAELAVVIGRRARRIDPADALAHVFGYTCANDVTAADILNRDASFTQWDRAKGLDTFCPMGPAIATGLDPKTLSVTTRLDGEVRQHYPISDMRFPVERLVSLISFDLTLHPGDVILCGTSVGVGSMKPGSLVEVEIDGIGTLANRFG